MVNLFYQTSGEKSIEAFCHHDFSSFIQTGSAKRPCGTMERLRAYYIADVSALSRAAMTREWDGKGKQFAIALIDERMELLHNAEELWADLLGI